MKKNKGFSIHCHHDTFIEYCYDYRARVKYIKKDKSKEEQEIRLRVFKLLPDEAVKDIPIEWTEAYQRFLEEDRKYQRVDKYQETDRWREAHRKYREADHKWYQESKDSFHAKHCGCKEWNGKELVFKK